MNLNKSKLLIFFTFLCVEIPIDSISEYLKPYVEKKLFSFIHLIAFSLKLIPLFIKFENSVLWLTIWAGRSRA